MSIQVRFFASLSDQLDRVECKVQHTPSITVGDIWSIATNGKPYPNNVLVAVNMEYANPEQCIEDGDEVAFFPPVTGG
jgi:molybdopterin synthase sulfur carrier subunit